MERQQQVELWSNAAQASMITEQPFSAVGRLTLSSAPGMATSAATPP